MMLYLEHLDPLGQAVFRAEDVAQNDARFYMSFTQWVAAERPVGVDYELKYS